VRRARGDYAGAKHLLTQALEYARKSGLKRQEARCLNDLAELDRFEGNLSQAESGYRQSMIIQSALGNHNSTQIAALNLGQIYSETGRTNEARTELERAYNSVKIAGQPALEGFALISLSYVHAQLDDVDGWNESFSEASRIFGELGVVELDVARTSALGGITLLESGHKAEALRSLEFARDHWVMLQRHEEAAALTDKIERLKKELTPQH